MLTFALTFKEVDATLGTYLTHSMVAYVSLDLEVYEDLTGFWRYRVRRSLNIHPDDLPLAVDHNHDFRGGPSPDRFTNKQEVLRYLEAHRYCLRTTVYFRVSNVDFCVAGLYSCTNTWKGIAATPIVARLPFSSPKSPLS